MDRIEYQARNAIVRKAQNFMLDHLQDDVSLDDVAGYVGCCKYSLIRLFKRDVQATPMRWLWQYRLEKARTSLETYPDRSIMQAAHEAGYTSLGHITSAFKRRYGLTPAAYRSVFLK